MPWPGNCRTGSTQASLDSPTRDLLGTEKINAPGRSFAIWLAGENVRSSSFPREGTNDEILQANSSPLPGAFLIRWILLRKGVQLEMRRCIKSEWCWLLSRSHLRCDACRHEQLLCTDGNEKRIG